MIAQNMRIMFCLIVSGFAGSLVLIGCGGKQDFTGPEGRYQRVQLSVPSSSGGFDQKWPQMPYQPRQLRQVSPPPEMAMRN
jgi:hypothetical protein